MKRDMILACLSRHHKNIVDNLVTKDNLSYTEVKQRLLDLDHEFPFQSTPHSANVTQYRKLKNDTSKHQGPQKSLNLNILKMLNPKNVPSVIYTFRWCIEDMFGTLVSGSAKEISLIDKGSKDIQQRSNAVVSGPQGVSLHPFYFDICTTAHMCPYPERFEQLSVCAGHVISSSNEKISNDGKVTVLLNCILSNGNISTSKICDVLYVP